MFTLQKKNAAGAANPAPAAFLPVLFFLLLRILSADQQLPLLVQQIGEVLPVRGVINTVSLHQAGNKPRIHQLAHMVVNGVAGQAEMVAQLLTVDRRMIPQITENRVLSPMIRMASYTWEALLFSARVRRSDSRITPQQISTLPSSCSMERLVSGPIRKGIR